MTDHSTKKHLKPDDYLANLFIRKDIPYSSSDIRDASTNLIAFFEKLCEIKMIGAEKPIVQTPIRKMKGSEYVLTHRDAIASPTLIEFVDTLTKEQIQSICFKIEDFKKLKEQTNRAYEEIHNTMTPEYKEFLLFKQAKKIKSELILSTISTSTIFDEKMALENQILSEFIDSPEYDEYGLPYYP